LVSRKSKGSGLSGARLVVIVCWTGLEGFVL
jgi:hypothetical protein